MIWEIENDLSEYVKRIENFVTKEALNVLKENKKKILFVWELIYELEETAYNKGVLEIEYVFEKYERESVPFYDAIKEVIQMLCDGAEYNVLIEMMLNNIYVLCKSAEDTFIGYFYLLFIKDINENYIIRNTDDNKPSHIMEKHLSLIPLQFQNDFIILTKNY